MSDCGPIEFYQGRQNQLVLTIYEDANQAALEDLTDRLFSVTIYHPEDLTVYATAVGADVDVDDVGSVITATFADDTFDASTWDQAEYIVDEITGAVPAPFLTPSEMILKKLPAPEMGD
mgnify:CR=1 FL=1